MVWITVAVTLVAAAVITLAAYSKRAARTDCLSTRWIHAHRADVT